METVTKHWSTWDQHDMSRAHAELIRLRSTIKRAHGALTKSSLTADERVFDATAVLAKEVNETT